MGKNPQGWGRIGLKWKFYWMGTSGTKVFHPIKWCGSDRSDCMNYCSWGMSHVRLYYKTLNESKIFVEGDVSCQRTKEFFLYKQGKFKRNNIFSYFLQYISKHDFLHLLLKLWLGILVCGSRFIFV